VTATAEAHVERLTGLIARYKLGVTVAELVAGSMESGRAHAFVTRLEKMMRDRALIGG
jgi:hypothetical protein